jgi:spoIIIJ-associated protein
MKKITVTGKSVEEAIQQGLSQLNTSADRVNINVLEQPTKGLFGLLGGKDAKVELELKADAVDEAVRFLQDIFSAMKIDIGIETENIDGVININLTGSEIGILIGRRGQTLDSLQYLVNIAANRFTEEHKRFILDAEEFRSRRRKTLESLSHRLAGQVLRSKREVVLEPMSPQERKIIHSYLQDHPKVKTYSKGEDPNRRVVITLK